MTSLSGGQLESSLMQRILSFTGATQDCVFNEDKKEHNFGRACCRSDGLPSDKDLITGTKICCNGTLHDREGQKCCNGNDVILASTITI